MLVTERVGEQLTINKDYGLITLKHCILIEDLADDASE